TPGAPRVCARAGRADPLLCGAPLRQTRAHRLGAALLFLWRLRARRPRETTVRSLLHQEPHAPLRPCHRAADRRGRLSRQGRTLSSASHRKNRHLMQKKFIAILACLVGLLAGALPLTGIAQTAATPAASSPSYVIGPGDVL